jgi:hypothetical protein
MGRVHEGIERLPRLDDALLGHRAHLVWDFERT